MPFLRVIRDKRGYETTYLMHWYREGNRQRSRILYVFRTPGGVRVGRTALEPEILRQIERSYPAIPFDWAAVRENQQIVDSTPDLRQRRERRPKRDEAEPPEPPPVAVAVAVRPPVVIAAAPAEVTLPPAPGPARPPIPAVVEGATPDEQIAFLARWYPIIRDRIPARTLDPTRQETLLALAERLNAAAWTDADQITTGLQGAREALERLSHVLAKRRRRARKRPAETAANDAPIAGS